MDKLSELRADFEMRSKRSMSMPIAGATVWCVIAILGMVLPFRSAILALAFGTGAIFPVAMVIARVRGEDLLNNTNPLASLMGTCVLMVNLLWALHIPLLMEAPQFIPLSLGIALGLHWMVYSWIIRHPLGYQHAMTRTVALVAVWFAFPEHTVTASAAVVVAAYLVTIYQMATRTIDGSVPNMGADRSSPRRG